MVVVIIVIIITGNIIPSGGQKYLELYLIVILKFTLKYLIIIKIGMRIFMIDDTRRIHLVIHLTNSKILPVK